MMTYKASQAEFTRNELGERVMVFEAGRDGRNDMSYAAMRAEDHRALAYAWQTCHRMARQERGARCFA